MTDPNPSPDMRQSAFEHQIHRLERKIASLESTSRRISWIRLALVLAGGSLTWGAATYLDGIAGWVTFIIAFAFFIAVAIYHRRLERWIEKFKIAASLCADRLARLNLDWEHIPASGLPATREVRPLEIDLDLTGRHSLHQLLDTTLSRQGSGLLADWLSQVEPDLAAIDERQAVVAELAALPRFRSRIALTFHLVSKTQLEGDKLLGWLAGGLPSHRLTWALPVAFLMAAANVALFVLNGMGRLPAYWIVSLLAYGVFILYNQSEVHEFLESVVALDTELGKFRSLLHFLEVYPYGNNHHLVLLCQPFLDPQNPPSRRLRKVKWVTAAVGLRMNPILSLLLNLIFPWDMFFAVLAARCRDQAAEYLPAWLALFHRLEGLIALANYAYLNPDYVFPEIHSGVQPVFRAIQLGHPLIPPATRVCNDFEVPQTGRLAIITGSNMAGKSTFIKTVGISLCLAYAGGPVCAQRLQSLPFRLGACIHITDSVTDGFSYFYAEVRCLRDLLEKLRSPDPRPLLFLVDEIFRGTNNRERLIGSRAYVKAAARENGVGLLATHDLELASLAEADPALTNYHFRDFVQDGRLVFDYKIWPGASPTTNALKIMQMEGLPVEVSPISHSENKNGPTAEPGAGGSEPER